MVEIRAERGYHLPDTKTESPQARKSIEQSTIWNKVRPLFMRGAIASEIAQITGLDRKQVNNSIHRKFKSTRSHRLIDEEFFTSQKTNERMSRGRKGKPKYLVDRLPPTQEEINSVGFVRRAQEEGFFTDDLTYWNQLNDLYENSGRELPSNFYDRLRLEAFLKALKQEIRANVLLIQQFLEIGDGINRTWFCNKSSPAVIEQRFIRSNLTPGR